MRTVTANVLVQMGEYCRLTPEDFQKLDGSELADHLAFYTQKLTGDYAIVGEAEITMTLYDTETLVDAKVDALKAKLQRTQADAEVACNRIREQIQSLLAISYRPAVVE